MSGEASEPDRDQMTASAPSQQTGLSTAGRYVPIAPAGLQQRLGTHAICNLAVSSVGVPQPTSGASGAAPPKKRREPGALTGKNVVVLKPFDVVERHGTVFMPNTIEMAQIKKTERGQFQTNVQFSSKMTETDIKRILVETFPFLECQRFYCAGAADNRTRLDFHGDRRIWDGRLIKRNIKGNSALYIYAEENFTVARQSSEHSRRQIEALGTNNQSQVSIQPLIPSVNPKSSKKPAACSITGPLLGSLKTSTAKATATVVNASSLPSVLTGSSMRRESLVVNQPDKNAHFTSLRSNPQDPAASEGSTATKRHREQMTASDNDPSNQFFKKLRTSKEVSDVANHDDPNVKTPLRSNGTPPAIKKVSEQSNCFIQEASNNTAEAIQPHSLSLIVSSNVPVGATPQMNNYWNTVSYETSAVQSPLSSNADQTVTARVLSKHDNHAPLQALSNRNSSLFDQSKQATNMSTQSPSFDALQEYEVKCIQDWLDNCSTVSSINTNVHQSQEEMDQNQATPQPLDAVEELFQTLNFGDLLKIDGTEPVAPAPRLTTSSSCSSFDSYQPASSINVNACELREEHQNQRDDIIQMPEPPQEKQAQVSRDRSKSDSISSGIGLDGSNFGLPSSDTSDSERSSNMGQIIPKAGRVSMFPPEVDLSGGDFCRFDFTPKPVPEVHLTYAQVGNLGNINLVKVGKYLVGDWIPPSDEPGCQTVTIWSQSGEKLGETELYYRRKSDPEFEDSLETVARKVSEDPAKMGPVLSRLAICSGGLVTNRSGETQNYGHLGSTRTAQVLLSLLYKAAECGAQVFIKMIFNSSAGRVIFHEYKDSVPLPEVIARNHGHENTALYLEEITARFSKDQAPMDPKRIDWPVFLAAINFPQDESNNASEDENPQPDVRNDSDSSYLGDVESLSCDSAEPSSDSEDDLSEMFSKVSVKEDKIQMEGNKAEKDEREFVYQPLNHLPWAQLDEKGNEKETHDWSNTVLKESISNDQTFKVRYRPVTALSGGLISLKKINSKGKRDKNQQILKVNDAFQIDEHDLQHWINLLSIPTEDIPRHLSTMHERWMTQIQFNKYPAEKTQQWLSVILQRMLLDPTEGGRSTQSTVVMKDNSDQDMESLYPDDDISIQNEDATLRRRLLNQPVNFCHSTVFEIWMLACLYGPSRKTLFVYIADRKDVFPPESWFKDEDCEHLMESWNWQRCRHNLVMDKVKRIPEQPANVSIKMKKQGLSLGCPKDVAPTAVKKLQVNDGRNLLDSDDEKHSTDANRDEREEQNVPRVENNESASKTESTDHQKNDGIGDGHSTTTQVSSSMESSNGYTDERCYRIRYIVAEGLRELFKQEWDTLYKSTIGEWKDEPRNGKDFYIKESPRNQERNAHLLATMKNGNRAEWDCTMLFYAILFSDCVGAHLNAKARKIVDDLRKFMNEEFAHMLQGSLSEIDFQNAFSKIDVAFEALRLSTVKIHDFKYQMFHLTEVLKEVTNHLKRQLQGITCQRQVLEDKVQKEAPSFCILPPKPLHVISNRDHEVEEILQQLKELKECSGNRLSCFHISGNPGSGKSQLAGLVAERFYDEVIEMPGGSSFVMTLNAANPDSLLESYASFARHLNYPDHSVMQILRTNGSVEAKIAHLEFLIATKIGSYTSWLLVVDNVTTMSTEHVHLPHFGAEAWARGQLLITTQDTTSLPLQSPFIKHISVSQGMEPTDARSLLAKLSGVADSELGTIIAQTLDYQPLALAGAAVFVGNIRQDKAFRHFGWKEYLTILEKEKWDNTEDTLVNTNSLYPNTMAKAVTLAVKFVIRSNGCVKQLFTFLSLCAPQPLNVDIAINYIMNLHEDFDEADRELILKMLMRCPLLLVEEKDGGHFIRAHQLVHDAIRIVLYESHERQNLNVVIGIVNSFHQFILALPRVNRRLHTIHIVPHVHAFSMSIPKVSDILSHDKLQVARALLKLQEQGATLVDVANTYRNLAMMHLNLGDCEQAKKYQHVALAINVGRLGVSQFSVATLYFELASMYKESGYLEEAKEYNQQARRIVSVKLEQVVPQDLDALEQPEKYHHALNTQICAEHLSVATGYSNLSLIRQDLGDLEQAKEFQQSSLAIPLKTLGAEHASVATSYSNLASIHQDLRDPEQAKEYQQRALAIKLTKLGADHVSVATSYSNLALIHHELGDLEKAKAYQQRAVAIQLKKLGGEHLSVATSYSNLAVIHHDLGDLEMAKAYQQRALGIQLKTLGAEHLAVAICCSNLASIHQDLGDLEQAKEYQQRALAIKLKKLGAEHLSVATSYSNLVSIHWDLGDLEQAREYQQRSLAIKLKRLGAEHLSVAVGYSNLALIHQEICDLEQANGYKQRTLHKERKELGAEHFSVARSFGNFSLTHTDLADLEKAREYQERVIAIDRKNLSAEHASVATSYSNLALVHKDLDSDDFRQSKEYQQRAPVVEFKERNSGNASEATNYKHPRSRNGLCFCLLL